MPRSRRSLAPGPGPPCVLARSMSSGAGSSTRARSRPRATNSRAYCCGCPRWPKPSSRVPEGWRPPTRVPSRSHCSTVWRSCRRRMATFASSPSILRRRCFPRAMWDSCATRSTESRDSRSASCCSGPRTSFRPNSTACRGPPSSCTVGSHFPRRPSSSASWRFPCLWLGGTTRAREAACSGYW